MFRASSESQQFAPQPFLILFRSGELSRLRLRDDDTPLEDLDLRITLDINTGFRQLVVGNVRGDAAAVTLSLPTELVAGPERHTFVVDIGDRFTLTGNARGQVLRINSASATLDGFFVR